MIKRTLYFSNPCYLKKMVMQIYIEFPEKKYKPHAVVPIEDIGILILDSPHITLGNALIAGLNQNNVTVLSQVSFIPNYLGATQSRTQTKRPTVIFITFAPH